MSKNLLNNTDEFRSDISKYLNAKEKLDIVFDRVRKYGALYLYNTKTTGALEIDFNDVFTSCLETCLKFERTTKDKNISRDHCIFYIEADGKIYRGLITDSGYRELRLDRDWGAIIEVLPRIEVIGFLDYQIERLGGEI